MTRAELIRGRGARMTSRELSQWMALASLEKHEDEARRARAETKRAQSRARRR